MNCVFLVLDKQGLSVTAWVKGTQMHHHSSEVEHLMGHPLVPPLPTFPRAVGSTHDTPLPPGDLLLVESQGIRFYFQINMKRQLVVHLL